jgi:hypothetical protein
MKEKKEVKVREEEEETSASERYPEERERRENVRGSSEEGECLNEQ